MARTDINLDAVTSAAWFYVPYPGNRPYSCYGIFNETAEYSSSFFLLQLTLICHGLNFIQTFLLMTHYLFVLYFIVTLVPDPLNH